MDHLACAAEALKIIRVGNTVPFPLNMADLARKGNTNFLSEVVMLTSNKLKPAIIGIAQEDAYLRRRDLCVEVDIEDRVAVTSTIGNVTAKRLDESLIRPIYGYDTHRNVWRLRFADPITGAPLEVLDRITRTRTSWLNYDQFIAVATEMYDYKQARQKAITSDIIRELGLDDANCQPHDQSKVIWTPAGYLASKQQTPAPALTSSAQLQDNTTNISTGIMGGSAKIAGQNATNDTFSF